MKLSHPEVRTRLSAEYVLGTLRGAARRRFEGFLRSDYGLRQEVGFWEARLTPLADRIKPVTPPDRVWKMIEARIDAQRRSSETKSGWLDSLAFWRGLGLVASVMLVAMLALKTNVGPAPTANPQMLAVLEEADGARMVIEQPKAGMLKARLVRDWKTFPDKSHELWVIPAKGAPRSLGLMNDQGETIIQLADLDSKLADGAVFAVTLEPKAGSGGSPTGPVLCKGSIARLPGKAAGQI